MAEKSSFFTSLNGDRKYKATDFAEYFGSFVGNGVFPNPSTNLEVKANEDMTITVKAGYAWINGHMYINTEDLVLKLDYADNSLKRIDKVVVRLDVINREIKVHVKKGEFSLDPVAPELQRDNDIHELGIGEIKVNENIMNITQENITDTRFDTESCGMVNSLIKVDIGILTEKFGKDFEEWFSMIKGALGDDVAGNLLNMILAIEERLDRNDQITLKASNILVDDIEGKFESTNVEDALLELSNRFGEKVIINTFADDETSVIGQIITLKYSDKVIEYPITSNEPMTILIPINQQYEISINDRRGYVTPSPITYISELDNVRLVEFKYRQRSLYGIKINKNDSNPDTRVEYIYDAVGMKPARMNFETGEFDYGDWKDVWFIKNNRPVMLRYDGTVDYELDRENQVLKADGGASDIENESYEGNAMSEIPLGWVNQWEDDEYVYHAVCNIQIDENYKAYPFTNANGVVNTVAYMSMYEGIYIGDRTRSLSNKTCTKSQTFSNTKTRAQANGSGWDIWYWSLWDYLCSLIKIISKSTDSQTCFGKGACTGPVTTTGGTKSKGRFWGSTVTTSPIKLFYIENLYGNLQKPLDGINSVSAWSGYMKVKMTPPYNSTADGYTQVSGTTKGYVKSLKVSTDTGAIPIGDGASSNTYYCDSAYNYGWVDTSVAGIVVGPGPSRGDFTGIHSLVPVGTQTVSDLGLNLSYLKP